MNTQCKPNVSKFNSLARNRIRIEQKILTDTNSGGQSLDWQLVNSYWGQIKPASGNEVFRSEQLQSRVTHKILIRYQAAFANTKDFGSYRIVYNSRIFNIKFVRNLHDDMETEGLEYQEIMAEENAAESVE
jgi:SPP1 family predicted phage head-tail adaptor